MTEPGIASQLPSDWLPAETLPELRAQLSWPVPDDFWYRWVADSEHGLPHVGVEAFWITGGVMHIVGNGGWVIRDDEFEQDLVTERRLGHERINIETVERTATNFSNGRISGSVTFTGGVIRRDLPMVPLEALYGASKAQREARRESQPAPSGRPDSAEIGHDGSLTLRGQTYPPGRFNIYQRPDEPGIRRCGLWVDGERQYGVAIYQEGTWLFTVPGDKAAADFVYEMIETGAP